MLIGLALDGKTHSQTKHNLMLEQTVNHKSKFNQVCGCFNGRTPTVRNGKENLGEIIKSKFLVNAQHFIIVNISNV